MIAHLKVLQGSCPGIRILIRGPRFLIGHDPECHLRPRDLAVSDRHCEILVEPGRLALRDLGSEQGTHLNGLRIAPACRVILRAGDRLVVGETAFEVQVGDQLEGAPAERTEEDDAADEALRLLQRRLGGGLPIDRRWWVRFVRERIVEGIPCVEILLPRVVGRTATVVWREILGSLATASCPGRLILDLRGVQEISAEAIEVLLAFRERAQRYGVTVKLCEVSPAVARALERHDPDAARTIHLDASMAAWSTW